MYQKHHLKGQPTNVRLAPGPCPYPLLNMLPHMRKGPHEFLLRAALEYGNVVQLGRPDRMLIAHPDGIKHVLIDNHQNYIKGKYAERLRLLIGNGLPASDGAFWLRQRRLMQPAFHRQWLAALTTIITDLTERMLDRWQQIATPTQPLDIAAEMCRLTQQIMISIMFGADIEAREISAIGQAFATVMEYFNYRNGSLFPLPEHWPTPRNHRTRQAQRLIAEFMQDMIKKRSGSTADADDMLSMLLAVSDEAAGEGMTDQQLCDELRAIFFGGYDTTSHALAWIWLTLAQHPHIEARLHEELAAVLKGRPPTFQDLSNLTYSHMVVEETLRLYPPAWALARTVVADDEIDGFHIPAGAKVVISPYVTHRLPALWEQPQIFDPEHFAPQSSTGRHRCAFIPFGVGARVCIGQHLAMLIIQCVTVTLAQRYRLCCIAGHSTQMHAALLLQPRRGLAMTIYPRRFSA